MGAPFVVHEYVRWGDVDIVGIIRYDAYLRFFEFAESELLRAVGRLTGGNLSLVQQSIGTPYEIDTRGAILFVEETRDPMSFVDERLVHLRAAGLLRNLRGIVFGHLSLDRSEEDEFEDFLLDLVSDLKVPVLMDFPAGHEIPNLTLPIGTEVELVVEETTGWLQYREDALESPPQD